MNNKLIYDKIIDLQLYQIKYTESYDVLNLVHRFSNKKLNKIGLVFLWFFCDFIRILKDLWFKKGKIKLYKRKIDFWAVVGPFEATRWRAWPTRKAGRPSAAEGRPKKCLDRRLIFQKFEGFFNKTEREVRTAGWFR
jgi:hypothetical protein